MKFFDGLEKKKSHVDELIKSVEECLNQPKKSPQTQQIIEMLGLQYDAVLYLSSKLSDVQLKREDISSKIKEYLIRHPLENETLVDWNEMSFLQISAVSQLKNDFDNFIKERRRNLEKRPSAQEIDAINFQSANKTSGLELFNFKPNTTINPTTIPK